ncbi:hypothetical protein AJ80_06134 [Polytolypa hystricis UAMH7299]|uniref:Zn(2)-C6 fungal-type domain-containing protein n=1 Tax=Polytolypa hystricis (strain UAMH7299) TaxID=1447883 RepID=A0A2B7XQE7_POLH7|nr:hypothetical protein AJ80_06134 [Polytolypa hystricis UAMH7299]
MENPAGSAADKKRNKLGYHRTSVACVHCRRRKIRCLVAEDGQRCENCIRLKKECNFFPVDQQPPVEKRTRTGSKTATTPTETSIPSSTGSGHMLNRKDSYFQYQPVPLSSSQEISPFDPGAFVGNPISTFSQDSLVPPEYNVVQPLNPSVPWDDPYFAQQVPGGIVKGQVPNQPASHWAQSSSPVAATPTTPGVLPPANTSSPYAPAPDGTAWNMHSARSMSLATPGDPSSYPSQYQAQPVPEFKRRMTAPVDTYSHPNINPVVPQLPSSPSGVSYGTQTPTVPYSGWNALSSYPVVTTNPSQTLMNSGTEALSGWYAPDTAHFDQMRQEGPILDSQGQPLNPPGAMHNPD